MITNNRQSRPLHLTGEKLFFILFFLVLVRIGAMATPAPPGPVDSLTKAINHIYRQGFFNGFAVSIVDGKGTLYEHSFGFADVEHQKPYTNNTLQSMASLSKTVVGIALLRAQEMGKLHLDDPVNQYLPFPLQNPYFPDRAITIRHLTAHTSSIIDNDYYLSKNYILLPFKDTQQLIDRFEDMQIFNPSDSAIALSRFLENCLSPTGKWYRKEHFAQQAPGSLYVYSNTGTALAAFILERATSQSFLQFTRQHIFKPLGMDHSAWRYQDIDTAYASQLYANPHTVLPRYETITYPDGGLLSSIGDMSLFLSELIRAYQGKGKLLSPESYRVYFKPQLSAAHFTNRNEQNPYSESYNTGIFIGYGYTGYIGHTGGDPGVMSMMFFDPETGLGCIMIYNTNFSDKKGNDAFYQIWRLLESYAGQLKE